MDASSNIEINAQSVIVNGQAIAVADSPTFTQGGPMINTHSSVIGDKVITSFNYDVKESKGMVTLSLVHTLGNLNLVQDWRDNVGKNSIRLNDTKTGFTMTFSKMSIPEAVEFDLTAESTQIRFEGNPGI